LQARVKAVADIVSHLIDGVQSGADVDLNDIKREAVTKYALQRTPKLVEIIAAVPEEWKANLLPRCAADGCCVMAAA
jgi:elongator complex protein 3